VYRKISCKNTGDELWYQGLLIAVVARARGDSKLVTVDASCRVCVSVPSTVHTQNPESSWEL
jgi:hypothetical protein